MQKITIAAFSLALTLFPIARGDEVADLQTHYLKFIRSEAESLRATDAPPKTLDDWRAQSKAIRDGLLDAWGGFPTDPCPLEPRILGTLKRDGYRIEKLIFQARPNVWITANLYLPDSPGKHAAILNVHGHWHGAKQDPTVQARCIGAVKLGFVALVVDAFGAGERGIGKALGEYHGATTGATLLSVGLPLSGLQVYENMRAVDYLQSRPEVDPDRIGITGASGGGNQTMYAGAWDDRLKAVVPVCSVGNYQAYLGTGCCMCEVVPGALRFTEEWGVLGLVAPRALMVVSASQDAPQFSVAEARKSIALAAPIFPLYDKPDHIRQTIINSKHDYNKAMREAMYGWMTCYLKGEGNGSPIPEPEIKTEDPETLRCYPGETRPDDWITIPRFAAQEGRRLLAAKPMPEDLTAWRVDAESRRKALLEKVFDQVGETDRRARLKRFRDRGWGVVGAISFKDAPLVVLIDFEVENGEKGDLASRVSESEWAVQEFQLRATGPSAWPNDKIGDAQDHHTAEWGLWIGRPSLARWVHDLRLTLDTMQDVRSHVGKGLNPEIILIGKGRGALVALCTGAIDPRVTKVIAIDMLSSYITEKPYAHQAIGLMAPGILREVGDIAQIAALIAPKQLVIAGGVNGTGEALTLDQLRETYKDTSRAWELLGQKDGLTLLEKADPAEVLRVLKP